jgi:hypothetical protein
VEVFCIIFLFNAKAEEFFLSEDLEAFLYMIFFYIECRRGGLDYICCEYEQPSQVIYFCVVQDEN